MYNLALHARLEYVEAHMNTMNIDDNIIPPFGRVKAPDECKERAETARRDAPDQDCIKL